MANFGTRLSVFRELAGFAKQLLVRDAPAPPAMAELGDAPACARAFRLPAGQRIYAIGDVHGRHDLLVELLETIDHDDRSRGPAQTLLVFLGDYIDRGPASRSVVDLLMGLVRGRPTICLMGNHEEILLHAAAGQRRAVTLFRQIGGRDTMMSYSIAPEIYDQASIDDQVALICNAIPPAHLDWMRALPSSHRSGDYVFVHAGLRPGVDLDQQAPADQRWIREEFLDSREDFGAMVIHGHSIQYEVDERCNRIGIDTGAFATGRLTAIGLEGEERWYLRTGTAAEPAAKDMFAAKRPAEPLHP